MISRKEYTEEATGVTRFRYELDWTQAVTAAASVIASLAISGFAYARRDGVREEQVATMQREITFLMTRDITPGAERRISVLEAKASMNERQFDALKDTIETRFDRLEAKIDNHMQTR